MTIRNLIVGVALAAAASVALGASTDAPTDRDIFGRPPVHQYGDVQELYLDEPYSDPLPQFWGFEHPQDQGMTATSRESGVQIEQENEQEKAKLEREGFPQYVG